MASLGTKRLDALAACLRGDTDPFGYRTHDALTDLFGSWWDDDWGPMPDIPSGGEASRPGRSRAFVAACNQTSFGSSGMPCGIESLVRRMLDIGEFDTTSEREDGAAELARVFEGYSVRVDTDPQSARLVSTAKSQAQQIIDKRFETVFGETISDSTLNTARLHFRKASDFIDRDPPDYENAVKEAVGSVESYLKTLTGQKDFKKAVTKARQAGVPAPIVAMIEKLYAWRGDEVGVAHAGAVAPTVQRADADFARNQAGVINKYLRDKLGPDAPG